MSRFLWTAVLTVFLAGASAMAKEYNSDGFSFEYPDDWAVAAKDLNGQIGEQGAIPAKVLAESEVVIYSPDMQAWCFMHTKRGFFTSNEENQDLELFKRDAVKTMADQGITAEILECRLVRINNRNFILLKVNGTSPDGFAVRGWSLVGSGATTAYMVQFMTPLERAGDFEPAFDKITQSVRIESGSLDWFCNISRVSRWCILGLAGCITIAAIILVRPNFMRRRTTIPLPPLPPIPPVTAASQTSPAAQPLSPNQPPAPPPAF